MPKVSIEVQAHTNSFIFAMVSNQILWLVHARARQLTRNYGTRVLPSQLDAWLRPTSESLAPTGGLAGCCPAYPPILCGPSKTRLVCVNSTATSHQGISSCWLFLNLAGVLHHIRASKACFAADLGFTEIHVDARAGDVMAGAGGAAGPAPDVRHQVDTNLQVKQ